MSACAVQNNILYLLGIIFKRCIQIKTVFPAKGIQNSIGKTALICARLPAHHYNSPFRNAQRLIRDHKIRVKFHLITKAKTLRAGPKWVIKRKTSWLDLINTDSTIRTGKALAEIHIISIHGIHHSQSISQIQYCLKRICKSFLNSRLHDQTVYNNGNRMFNIFVQGNLLGKFIHISIDFRTHITAASGLIQ